MSRFVLPTFQKVPGPLLFVFSPPCSGMPHIVWFSLPASLTPSFCASLPPCPCLTPPAHFALQTLLRLLPRLRCAARVWPGSPMTLLWLCWLLLPPRLPGAAPGCCCLMTWTSSHQQQQERGQQEWNRSVVDDSAFLVLGHRVVVQGGTLMVTIQQRWCCCTTVYSENFSGGLDTQCQKKAVSAPM